MNNQEKVLNYLKDKDISPLHFKSPELYRGDLNRLSGDMDDLLRFIMKVMRYHDSFDKNDDYDTSSVRWRSSLDIWRHVIYYFPNITIFSVMKSLYNIREECGGQYCTTVHRRTFKLKVEPSEKYWSNQVVPTHGNPPRYLYGDEIDEYGLIWFDWENIE